MREEHRKRAEQTVRQRRDANAGHNVARDEFTLPILGCLVCGNTYGAETDYHYLRVCSPCAEAIGNFYNHAHSGNYITWFDIEAGRRPYEKDPIPPELRWKIWERDNFTCLSCGIRSNLSVDHVHPESRGGTLDENNLQTLCRPCNSKKGCKV